jgi:formate/nitrite transporter FocA (FNT family)
MVFDPKIALDYARKISRPRRVGTIEEKKVAQEIADQLTLFGFTVNFQPFQFSSSLGIFLTAEIITGQVLILTTILTYGVSQWLTLMQIVLLVFLIAIIGPINKKVQTSSIQSEDNEHPTLWSSICWRLGAHYKTKNIIAALYQIFQTVLHYLIYILLPTTTRRVKGYR